MIDPTTAGIIESAISAAVALIKRRPKIAKEPPQNLETRISQSINDAINWAASFQVVGMMPESTNEKTIPLSLTDMPRRFRFVQDKKAAENVIEECQILQNGQSTLLLGDPGCGKTTTLKRLTHQLILGDSDQSTRHAIPLVLRFKELAQNSSIIEELANRLGLPVEWRGKQMRDQDSLPAGNYWIGQELARDVLSDFFAQNRSIIILDGLDEYQGRLPELIKEMNWLQRNSNQSQVIVSCRSGAEYEGLENFVHLEVKPLTAKQVDQIALHLSVDPTRFRRALSKIPYIDIIDRPLHLVQLLIIFKSSGTLPDYRVDTYRLILELMLRVWDEDKSVQRYSKYSKFSANRKAQFLAALAYYLTFDLQTLSFDTRQLQSIYLNIRSRFDLPLDEERQVIREVESHTGLVISTTFDRYEFSHLSLQEFLAAEYISRNVGAVSPARYISVAPEASALAVTLVSDPTNFLISLFGGDSDHPIGRVSSFIHRLLLERATFDSSPALGIVIIKMFARYETYAGGTQLKSILRLFQIGAASDSVNLALKLFQIHEESDSTILKFKVADEFDLPFSLPAHIPKSIQMKRRIWEDLILAVQHKNSIAKDASNSARRLSTKRKPF